MSVHTHSSNCKQEYFYPNVFQSVCVTEIDEVKTDTRVSTFTSI